MRYFIAGLGSESHSRSPIATDREAFTETCLYHGDASRRDFAQGLILKNWRELIARDGDTTSEGLCAFAQPGAPLSRALFVELRDELLADLAAAQPVEVVLLLLHGAMLAEGSDDCEGDLLYAVRQQVGKDVVIAAFFDLHAHLTPQKLANADLLLSGHEYPHYDVLARTTRLYELARQTARRQIRPHSAVYDCRMVGLWPTTVAPLREIVAEMQALETRGEALAVSLIHGFPFGDTADTGAKALVITDGDPASARKLATTLGQRFFAARNQIDPPYFELDAALDEAGQPRQKPMVLAEIADNPDSGAAGDSTQLLRRLIERGERGVLAGVLHDSKSTQACYAAGRGATIDLRLGGKASPLSGPPLFVRATVLGLSPSWLVWPFGRVAWIETAGIEVLISTNRRALNSPAIYRSLGIDPQRYRVLVVKSANHFEAGFAPIASVLRRVIGVGDTAPNFATRLTKRSGRYFPKDAEPFLLGESGLWD